jgi:hypothetical protein
MMSERTYYTRKKKGCLPVLPPPDEEIIESPVITPPLLGFQKPPAVSGEKKDVSVGGHREGVVREILREIARKIAPLMRGLERRATIVLFLDVCEHEGLDYGFLEDYFSTTEISSESVLVDGVHGGLISLLELLAKYMKLLNKTRAQGAMDNEDDVPNAHVVEDISLVRQVYSAIDESEFIEKLDKENLLRISLVVSCKNFDSFKLVGDTLFCFDSGLWVKNNADKGANPLREYISQNFNLEVSHVAKMVLNRRASSDEEREENSKRAREIESIVTQVIGKQTSTLYGHCKLRFAASPTFECDLDTNDHLMSCLSGVFDHNTGKMRHAVSTDMLRLSNRQPIPWDHETGEMIFTPEIEKNIEMMFDMVRGNSPSYEEGEHMLDVLAYATHGDRTKDAMGSLMFIHGRGGNGKSETSKILCRTFGDYAATCKIDVWTNTKNTSNAPETDLIGFKGKRLIITSEIKGGVELQTEKLKKLTGGDVITPREMYTSQEDSAKRYAYKGTQVILLYADQMPTMDTTGKGIARRFLQHSYPYQYVGPETFDPTNPRHKLGDKDALEYLYGHKRCMAFMMGLLRRYQTKLKPLFAANQRIHVPQVLIQRTSNFIDGANEVNHYLTNCLEPFEGHAITLEELVDDYNYRPGATRKTSTVLQMQVDNTIEWKRNMKARTKRLNGGDINAKTWFLEHYRIKQIASNAKEEIVDLANLM